MVENTALPAYTHVNEPGGPCLAGIDEVPAVHHEGNAHRGGQAVQVEPRELGPLCHDHEGVRPLRKREGIVGEMDRLLQVIWNCLDGRVVRSHADVRLGKSGGDLQRYSVSEVVSVGLEGEAEQAYLPPHEG